MSTWTTINDNDLLPGEPWTSAKALGVYHNPIAIAEGATGAPRVEPTAMEAYVLGPNETYANASGNEIGVLKVHIAGTLTGGGGGICEIEFRYRTSTDGGVNWTGYTVIYTNSVAAASTNTVSMFHNQTINLPANTNAVETDVVETLPGGGTTDYAVSYFLHA